ncbi:hypothetical protein AB0D12_27440 [Streptomyces sp. NPDC048479]|uniref:hypothetical protein n=1 Tax=Streptomyces sp. NPDC048479 TaxID=3154725 RepID=UPI0034290D88
MARSEAETWQRLGDRGAWAVTRGVVAVASFFGCLALMVITAIVADSREELYGPLSAASSVFLAMMLGCGLVLTCIAIFNRPRFLVPPYLRDKRRL